MQAITKTSGALLALASLCLVAAGCVRAGYDAERTDGPEPTDLASEARDGQLLSPGSLDPTFGGKGYVLLPVNPTQIDQAKAVALDTSGRIVVAGQLWNAATGNDFFVARYLASGALDTSFNNGRGFVQTGSDKSDVLDSMVIDGKGRIVVGGTSYAAGVANELGLARYTAAGTLDASFGTGGESQTDVSSGDDHGWNLAIDAGDNIFVVGRSEDATKGRMLVLKLRDDGVPDSTFGTQGVYLLDPALDATGRSISLDASGRVVAVGDATGTGDLDVVVLRLHPDGSPDLTLGGTGHVLIDPGRDEKVRGSTLDGAGRLLVTGWQDEDATSDSYLLRVWL